MTTPDTPPSDNTRKSRLALAVQKEVLAGGRVETQGDYNAVVRFGKGTNHVLHLILSVITVGVWLPVWALLVIVHTIGKSTVVLSVDEFGNLLRQKA